MWPRCRRSLRGSRFSLRRHSGARPLGREPRIHPAAEAAAQWIPVRPENYGDSAVTVILVVRCLRCSLGAEPTCNRKDGPTPKRKRRDEIPRTTRIVRQSPCRFLRLSIPWPAKRAPIPVTQESMIAENVLMRSLASGMCDQASIAKTTTAKTAQRANIPAKILRANWKSLTVRSRHRRHSKRAK